MIAPTNAKIVLDEGALHAFAAGLRGALITPGDDDYDTARKVWNGAIDRRPAYIVRCAGADDVARAVNFARVAGLPVSVRGGGHSTAGFAVRDGSLVIDLSQMKSIAVDPQIRMARADAARPMK